MTNQTRSPFIQPTGTNNAGVKSTLNMPQQTLDALAKAIVLACAQVQFERSCQRHGYDKYGDGEAIAQRFGLTTLQ